MKTIAINTIMPLLSTPADSPQIGDSRPPSGSPSSDTPETDDAEKNWVFTDYKCGAKFARKLEHERNLLKAKLAKSASGDLTASQNTAPSCDPNAQVLAPAGEKTQSTKSNV